MSDGYATINFYNPRTVWVLSFQLIYTICAMIPFFYYMREVLELPEEARYVVVLLPLTCALVIYMLQLMLNKYYWDQEKIYKKRDILQVASKSAFYTYFIFYFMEFLVFGFWLNQFDAYIEFRIEKDLARMVVETIISMLIVVFYVTFLLNLREVKFESRNLKTRIASRRKNQ
ncbi:MAG: hypothetical protein OEZ01_09320 [Candidatus Heimdallarchaeota archaeon]|nr:hypothetical protein [Candidatus Heimdallarchaeota archaeon]MDH5646195.1 hypothetical protein [Candidatus Heimdallarchaeota archaeon]